MNAFMYSFSGGDSSNFQWRHLKEMSKQVMLCGCGYQTEKTAPPITCNSVAALQNHIVFPTLPAINRQGKHSQAYFTKQLNDNTYKMKQHWALLVDIEEVEELSHEMLSVKGYTYFAELVDIVIHVKEKSKKEYATLIGDIKRGHSLAILYAERSLRSDVVFVSDLSQCYVFREAIEAVQFEATRLLDDADSMHNKKKVECFGCGSQFGELKRCSSCKLAKYCSPECQKKAWKVRHKQLCSQEEVLLRLSCLPRHHENTNFKFTFDLKSPHALPSYIYNEKFVNKSNETVEKPTPNDRCGLCKKTNKESYADKGSELVKTICCNNWICQDLHVYKMNTFANNSCHRNHTRYTVCGAHHAEGHKGKWQDCKQCKIDMTSIDYQHKSTNQYNFDKLKNVRKTEIHCSNCGFVSFDLNDFSGSQACCSIDQLHFCRREECRKAGGFAQYPPDATPLLTFKFNDKP